MIILQIIMALACAVLLVKSFRALIASGSRTRGSIKAGWLMVCGGSFGTITAILCVPTAVPVLWLVVLVFGEATIAAFTQRAAI